VGKPCCANLLRSTAVENSLIVEGAAKRFGGVTALSGASLDAKSKQIHAIIGPNGAGKTTLINIISGVYPPDEGSVRLNGEVLNGLRSSQIARKGIARTFQNVALFAGMSVVQNILLGRNMLMKSGVWSCAFFWGNARREEVEHRRRVEEIIDMLNLTDIRRELAGSLPLGLQKRVELGRALASDPKLLLLDEPMGGMNVEEKEDMCRYILDVIELTDTAVLLIEHDMGVVMDISDYIVVLDQGKKIGEGTPKEILKNQDVIDAYLGASH
jgi:branched-chain amino acid transport system ATP-binding protein